MSTLVESLGRLYNNGRITSEKINTMLLNEKITQEEYEYIINQKSI